MINRTSIGPAGLAAAAVALLALSPTGARAQTVLTLNNWLPPGHSQLVGVIEPWAEQVEEATEGRVQVELTAASLGAPPRQYDLVVDGIVDIAFGVTGYTPGRFNLPTIAELPFIAESGEARSVGLWRVHEEHFADVGEFEDVVLLGLYAHGAGKIWTTGTPVLSAADWEGLKFRVGGGIVDQINPTMGGVNVAAPANEVYEILSQGVADGTLFPTEAIVSFNLEEVIGYGTDVPGGLYSSAWFVAMNRETWDSLAPEDQEAILSVSGEHLAKLGGGGFDRADEEALGAVEEAGVEFTVADDAFTSELRERLAFIEEDWLEQAGELGVDGAAALEMMYEVAGSYAPAD